MKKSEAELKEEAMKQDKAMQREIAKGKNRSVNAGYSEPGYNFGLGSYVKDREDYKRIIREKRAEDPNFQEVG